MNLKEIKIALRNGKHAWPGGYPLYFVTKDGAALSFEAVRSEWRQVVQDYLWSHNTGWQIEAVTVNHEDKDLTCDHSGKPIESALDLGEPS